MQIDWPIVTAVIGTIGAAFGYIWKRYVDIRLEAISRFHSQKFDAVVNIRGLLLEVDHCVLHLSDGDESYSEPYEKYCRGARRVSREQSAVLGDEFVYRVRDATDTALMYLTSRSKEDRNAWHEKMRTLLEAIDSKLREVELSPGSRTSQRRTKGMK